MTLLGKERTKETRKMAYPGKIPTRAFNVKIG